MTHGISIDFQQIPKVQVEVYYEVLCPDSRSFVIHQLSPTWEKLKSIMDVHLKPYGKAQVSVFCFKS